jgi:hypothetical protein
MIRRMRIVRLGLCLLALAGTLGVDVEESWRAGTISDGSAHAKPHKRRKKRRRKKRSRRTTPPPTEM